MTTQAMTTINNRVSGLSLMQTDRKCHICDIIGVHPYHFITDHSHKIIPNVTPSVDIELDDPCSSCEPGESQCCSCYAREQKGCNESMTGMFFSICKDCSEYANGLQEHAIYQYCVLCPISTACPECENENKEIFDEVYFSAYQETTINCATCLTSYSPRDSKFL